MKKHPRLHEYPAEFYESHEEWKECRYISRWHAVVAWIVTLVIIAGFVMLGLSVVALFRA